MLFSDEVLFFFFSGGIINGTILSMILLLQKPHHLTNKLLGSLILLFSIELSCVSFFDKSIVLYFTSPGHVLLMAVVNFMFLYGVLFYFYVRSMVYEIKPMELKDVRHIIPFFFFILVCTTQYLTQGQSIGLFLMEIFSFLHLGMTVLGGVYLVFSFKLLRLYRIKSQLKYSNPDKINLNWLTNITILQILLWGVSIATGLMVLTSGIGILYSSSLDELFYLVMTALILFTGYFALRHPETFNLHLPLETVPAHSGETGSDREAEKKAAKGMYKRLLEIMKEQKPHLNPDLTIDELSNLSKIPVYLLSRIINEYSGGNFFNFVNAYRVEEVKFRLSSAANKENLLSIALDCGFSSKTTFNTIFKKRTTLTPTQYRQQAAVPS